MLICIEGIDAAGKNTQSHRLAEFLKGTVYSFPNYNSPMGKIIAAHLARRWTTSINGVSEWSAHGQATLDPMVFQAVMLANRMEIVTQLDDDLQYRDIVLDRWWPSGVVYGGSDGLSEQYLMDIQAFLPQPDLFLLLDVDPKDSQERRPERRDRYEANAEKMIDVAQRYRRLWHSMEKATGKLGAGGFQQHWRVIDARGEKDNTFRLIREAYLECANKRG